MPLTRHASPCLRIKNQLLCHFVSCASWSLSPSLPRVFSFFRHSAATISASTHRRRFPLASSTATAENDPPSTTYLASTHCLSSFRHFSSQLPLSRPAIDYVFPVMFFPCISRSPPFPCPPLLFAPFPFSYSSLFGPRKEL